MNLNCSFCDKSMKNVQTLIAGPNVYICNECVALAVCVLTEEHSPKIPEFQGHAFGEDDLT